MARTITEAQLHKAVAQFLAQALPHDCWTTFPAGGGGKARGARLKASGLRAGWPDLQVIVPTPRPGASYFIGLELKTATGRLSPEQVECHAAIRKAGGYVFVCRSVDEVEGYLRGLGLPLCATAFGLGTRRTVA